MLNSYLNMMTVFINKYGSEKTISNQAAVMAAYKKSQEEVSFESAVNEAAEESIPEGILYTPATHVFGILPKSTRKQAQAKAFELGLEAIAATNVANLIKSLNEDLADAKARKAKKQLDFIADKEIATITNLLASLEGKTAVHQLALIKQAIK